MAIVCMCFVLQLVTAIDKKADVASVNSSLLAQKRALEDAIRKRVEDHCLPISCVVSLKPWC